MSQYTTAEETAPLVRQATTDEQWLEEQLQRIAPNRLEMGAAGDAPALRTLAIDLRIAMVTLHASMEYLRECVHNALGERDALRFDMALLRDQVGAVPVEAHPAQPVEPPKGTQNVRPLEQPKAERRKLTDLIIFAEAEFHRNIYNHVPQSEVKAFAYAIENFVQGGAA